MRFSILYFNDVHGYLQPHPELFYEGSQETIREVGGYSRLAGYIKEVKSSQPNTLVFDGGDTFHGTLPVVESKGEILPPILSEMQIDAMVGHWDFAYGPQQLKKLASQLSYPLLGINVYNADGSLFLSPYIIKKVGEVKVAVIGICSNIIDKTMPRQFSAGLKITDGTAELPQHIQKVKEEGAQVVILLSHNGFPQDCELLSKIPGVDICLSAHTHNRLYEAVKIKNSIIIQCGCHGSFIGHLDIELEKNKIAGYNYRLKTVDESFPVCSDTETKIKATMASYALLQSEIVGNTPAILHRYNIFNSGMDNLLLAAMLQQTGTQLAFSNGWRYGIPINQGNITRFQLFNIVPHNPVIETVVLTGGEILEMLEGNLERTFSASPMQQMGGYVKRCMGLTAYIKIENPKGHRIQELFIGDEHCQKEKRYTASFVTEQGVPKKYGSNRQTVNTRAVEAMAEYLKTGLFTASEANAKGALAI